MSLHVVVGSGPVGSAVSQLLLDAGEQVRVITRSGAGVAGAEQVRADASDGARMSELVDGAVAVYNCVNPPYDRWPQLWPPIADALLRAAAAANAVLATTGNLYGYGPVAGSMSEDLPLAATGAKGQVRAQMWRTALQWHEAGRVRVFEVRGSDYIGGPQSSLLSLLALPAWRRGRTAWLPADLDAPHSWTDVADVARLLVTGVQDERAWGKPWHVPTAAPLSLRELAAMAATALDLPAHGQRARVRSLPPTVLWAAGLASPMVRELRETQHQFRSPFVLDSTAAQSTFALTPTPTDVAIAREMATAAPLR